MASKDYIKLEGVDKTIMDMIKWKNRQFIPDINEAIKETAKQVKKDQINLVRKDELDLKKSISIKTRRSKGISNKEVGPKRGTTNPQGNGAHFHEYGTVKLKPQPFVKPSEVNNKPQFERKLKAICDKKVFF